MRKVAALVLGAIAIVVVVVLVRTFRFRPPPPPRITITEAAVDSMAARRLAGALRFPTISGEDTSGSPAAFSQLHAYLRGSFPRVHAALERETIAEHSVLYRWAGSDTTLRPVLFAAHLDVVPVEAGTERAWQHPPFGGVVADGYVWGRGAIDNKSAVLGMLEAAELLLAEGFRPRRTVYFAFGHDEEVGGSAGAAAIARELRRRGIRLELVLDEGGVIGDGLLPGISRPTALVGVAEKGFVSLELTARAEGGHSSLPPRSGAIGILSAGIGRLEEHQMRATLDGATDHLFRNVGPHFAFGQRAMFANLWLTRPLVLRALASNPTTNAMIRTTTAVTIFQAGTKDNVLPSHARAVVNFRIIQGDSVAHVLDHVRRVVDDPRITVRRGGRFSAEASAVSSPDSPAYRALERAILGVMPEAIVTPYLVVVVADARHYADLSENIFRFLPIRLEPSDLPRMHGTNERVAVPDYERAIRVYRQALLESAAR